MIEILMDNFKLIRPELVARIAQPSKQPTILCTSPTDQLANKRAI
jgi:hypothetical protein